MTGLLVPMRVLRQPAATTGGSAGDVGGWDKSGRNQGCRAGVRDARRFAGPRPCRPVVRRDRPALWWGRALVAQLDRAPDFESGGREFESLRARQIIQQYPDIIASRMLALDSLSSYVRMVSAGCAMSRLFDHLVGAGE